MALRIVAAAFAILLLLGGSMPARAAETALTGVHSITGDDGSVQIILAFNGEVPSWRVIHNTPNLVHIVLFNTELMSGTTRALAPGGQIVSGGFASFAGVGLRLDIATKTRVLVKAAAVRGANELVIHIPAANSDEEASGGPTTIDHGAMQTAFIPLSYADVSEVAGLLVQGATVTSLDGFTPQSPFAAPTANPNSSSSYNAGNTKTPTYVTLPTANIMTKDIPQGQRLNEHVAIDRRLNAIILTDTPDEIARYKKLIAAVDVPQPSILLEAEVVELTESAALDLGIDYSPNGQPLADGNATFSSGSRALSTVALHAQLSALQSSGAAKILARPRILTLNARTAAILSGEAVPIVNTVVVTTGGSPIIENQVQYINVGVSLQILPRVGANGDVTTQVFSEVSSILDYVGNAPRIAVRQGLTSGIVGDGESLLVGGLMQQTEITSLSKVPGLGDLPLIGAFFRNTSKSSQTTNLYIVVTPHVITVRPRPSPAK